MILYLFATPHPSYFTHTMLVNEHYNYSEVHIIAHDINTEEKYDRVYTLLQYLKLVDINLSRKVYLHTNPGSYTALYQYCDGVVLTVSTNDEVMRFLLYKDKIEGKHTFLHLKIMQDLKFPYQIDLSKWITEKVKTIGNYSFGSKNISRKLKSV